MNAYPVIRSACQMRCVVMVDLSATVRPHTVSLWIKWMVGRIFENKLRFRLATFSIEVCVPALDYYVGYRDIDHLSAKN